MWDSHGNEESRERDREREREREREKEREKEVQILTQWIMVIALLVRMAERRKRSSVDSEGMPCNAMHRQIVFHCI